MPCRDAVNRHEKATIQLAPAGLTHLLAITNFGGLGHKKVLRSMELLARHVLPAFR